MKVIRVYQYEKCSTCREALKFLANNNLAVEPIDIFTQPPTVQELKQMLSLQGGNIKRLLNTNGHVYKDMNLKEKLSSMTEEEVIALLAKNGKLVKRPFVLFGEVGLVGFQRDEWKKKLGKN